MDSIYYWYYATIAMFQVGGKAWETWNSALTKTLLVHQRRGGCLEGSWDPPDNFWGQVGGRLYSTTLNILNLEIYYRYLPLLDGDNLKTIDALVKTVESSDRANSIQALRLLARFEDMRAREYLIKMSQSSDAQWAMEAALALADRRDVAAIEPLRKQLQSPDQFVRYRALRALQPMIGQGLVPVFIQALNDEKPVVARQADQALRQYANVSFGFEPEASPAERREAIKKWWQWWEQHQKGAVEIKSTSPWLVVRVRPDKGLVVFSTGEDRLTETAKKYNVYRGETYIGRIDVVKVDGELCVAQVLNGYSADQIQEGDVVKPGR